MFSPLNCLDIMLYNLSSRFVNNDKCLKCQEMALVDQLSISAISLAKDTVNPTDIVNQLRSKVGIQQILTHTADFFFFYCHYLCEYSVLMLYLLTITWLRGGYQLTMYIDMCLIPKIKQAIFLTRILL